MNFSGIIGLCILCGLVAGAAAMSGNPAVFVNVPAAMIVGGITAGAGLMAFGAKGFMGGVLALRVLILCPAIEERHRAHARVLRGLIPSAYGAGVIGTALGAISMLATMDDPSSIGASIAVALLTVLYAALLAEGLLRPAAKHIEQNLEGKASD